jgi:hypothetical protein
MVELTVDMSPEEFRERYFLKEELKDFCRAEGLRISGSKEDLEKRIVHYLETGEELSEASVNVKSSEESGEITLDSRLGENFRCSEDKRAFFEGYLGKGFKFKVKFQKWLKANPDRTYADAIDAYLEIMNSNEKTEIGSQFQYNRYIRDFFADNDGRTLDDAIICWKHKKSLRGHNKYEKSDLEALM